MGQSHLTSQRADPQRSPFCGLCLQLLTQNDHVRQDNTCGEGRVSWGHPRLPSRGGAEPQSYSILGVLYLCLHLLTQNDHVRQGNTWGRGVFLGVSHASHPRGDGAPALPNFCVLCIYVFTVRRRMTKFGVGVACFGGFPCHCILHTCVARFVSDS